MPPIARSSYSSWRTSSRWFSPGARRVARNEPSRPVRTAPSPSMLRMKARKTFSPPRETITRRALDRPALLVHHAARERRAAGERDVLRLRLPGGDRDRARPRHEAVVLGGDAVRLGREPAHRVAAVRARAGEELPALGPGHDADAGEGLSVRGVHDPPGERRGRGEGDRDGLGGRALGQHRRGAAAVPAVGHERARLARRAVEEEGAVRARLHPARRLRAPLEPHEGARGRACAGRRG